MRKINTIITIIITGLMLILTPAMVLAQSKTDVCSGAGLSVGATGCAPQTGGVSVDSAITTGVNILSVIVGIIAVIMIIIGGLKFITSSGDANNISSARNTIIYAIVGLVIVVFAQFIVRFVLKKVS